MLVYLFELLSSEYSFFTLFRYLTLRGILAVLTSLTICFVVGDRKSVV